MTKITIKSEKKDYTFGDIPHGGYFILDGNLYLKNPYETIRGNYNCVNLNSGGFNKSLNQMAVIPVVELNVITK